MKIIKSFLFTLNTINRVFLIFLFNIINLINNNISLKYYYYNIYYVK